MAADLTRKIGGQFLDRGGAVVNAAHPSFGGLPTDGIADAQPAIQAAIDYATGEGGGLVIVPHNPNGYHLGAIVHVKGGVTFDGNRSRFFGNGGYGHWGALFQLGQLHTSDGGAEAFIDDCHIRGAICTWAVSGDIKSGDIYDLAFFDPDAPARPIVLQYVRGGSVSDCRVRGARTWGIGVLDSEDVEITRNVIGQIRHHGVGTQGSPNPRPNSGVRVHGNFVEDCGYYAFDLHTEGDGTSIYENIVRDCTQFAKSQTDAPFIVHHNRASLLWRGDAETHSAILVTGEGSKITNNEIRGGSSFVLVSASDVEITFNRFVSDSGVGPGRFVRIAGHRSGITVLHNHYEVTRASDRIIDAAGADNSITDSRIEDNTIVATFADTANVWAANISGSSDYTFNRNTFRLTTLGRSDQYGIFLHSSRDFEAFGNVVEMSATHAEGVAMRVQGCGDARVAENQSNHDFRFDGAPPSGTSPVRQWKNEPSGYHSSSVVADFEEGRLAALNGSGDPNGAVMPRWIGDVYIDTSPTPRQVYVAATGVANDQWRRVDG